MRSKSGSIATLGAVSNCRAEGLSCASLWDSSRIVMPSAMSVLVITMRSATAACLARSGWRSRWVKPLTASTVVTTLPRRKWPVEGQGGHVMPSNPRRIELGTVRHNQQHRKGSNPINGSTERFQACRVDPMRVLEDHQHRILTRQCLHLRGERFQGFLPALLRVSSSAG